MDTTFKVKRAAINTFHHCLKCGQKKRCFWLLAKNQYSKRMDMYVCEDCFMDWTRTDRKAQDESNREPVQGVMDAPVGNAPGADTDDDTDHAASQRANTKRRGKAKE